MIENVRGMRDLLPETWRIQRALQDQLGMLQASYGYGAVDLPVLEPRDLYLKKLGEELVGKVFEFSFAGRDLALRPEWTASVLRAYIAHMQDQPLPLRVSYCGPVFRYERPQRATYRQFTQQGVELIGGTSPRGEAEVIALACAGLDLLGMRGYRLILGHIGLVRTFLAQLGIDERSQGMLAWSLERLRSQGIASVRERLREARGDQVFDPALLEGMSDEQASALLLRVLQALDVNVRFGTRPPEAIVGRLLRKLRRVDPEPQIERALEFLVKISQIQGPLDIALPQAAALLAAYDLSQAPLDELRVIGQLLEAHGIAPKRLTIDLGLGRGLHYYTGAIFEIYSDSGMQLCGGGRYDDLVTALGGRAPVPAVGFAYGIERVALALEQQGRQLAPAAPPQVLVAALDEASYPYALSVAERLRRAGYGAQLDVRARSASSNLRDALRRGVGFLALVGPDEQAQGQVLWRDLTTREEQRIAIEDLLS